MAKESPNQAKDTGLAMVLILLLATHFLENLGLVVWAMGVLVLVMVWPSIFSPLARVWFGFSTVLGTVGSKVLLTLLFAFITTPIGLVRRLFGADAMGLKSWKTGTNSAMVAREHRFTADDLEKPY